MYAERIQVEAASEYSFPLAPPSIEPQLSRYGGGRRLNWPAIGGVLVAHGLLLGALLTLDVVTLPTPRPAPIMVEMLSLPPDPPPAPPPEAMAEPVRMDPPIVAPPPVVRVTAAAPPPLVLTTPEPPPPVQPRVVAAAPAPPSPAPPATTSGGDLSSAAISAPPPTYPRESRRQREEGTVLLEVTLSTDGTVASIRVRQSSGAKRLDEAAVRAVRRWRWSPTIRNGEPMMVTGTVPVDFRIG